MNRIPIRVLQVALLACACLAGLPAAWAVTAGTMEFVLGDVRIRAANGVERKAVKGASVEIGDTVLTGPGGTAQMRMVDNAFLAVRPDSELAISDYTYSGKSDGNENALLRLAKGTLRAFTGAIAIGRKEHFKTVTPTATIGIRGSGNVAFYSPSLGTLNHTIEGSHVVSSVNQQGQVIGTLVTTPGQTVQVMLNQAPVRVPTPPFLLEAASSPPRPAAQQGEKPAPAPGQKGEAQGEAKQAQGEAAPAAPARASAAPDTALASAATSVTTAAPTLGTVTTTLEQSLTGTVCDPSVSTTCVQLSTTAGTASSSTGTVVPLTSVQSTSSTGTLGSLLTQLQVLHSPTFASTLPNGLVAGVWAGKAVTGGQELLSVEPGHRVNLTPDLVSLDSSNNLVEIKQANRIDAHGLNYTDTTTDIGSSTGTSAGRYMRFVGGTPYDSFSLADGTFFMGRRQGGSINLYSDTGLTGGTLLLESIPLGLSSAHWVMAVAAPQDSMPRLTGALAYPILASTSPTDSLGNSGTLNSASFKADFSAQTIQTAVNVSFASRGITIDALSPLLPLEPGGGFNSESGSLHPPTINGCTGLGCAYLGRLNGGIGLADATGSVLAYAFAPNSTAATTNTPYSDLIQGVVAFKSASAPAVGTNPTPVGARGLYAVQALYPVSGGGNTFQAANRTTSAASGGTGLLPASAFVMNGTSLMRVVGAAWNVSDRGTPTQCSSGAPCLYPSTPGADSLSIFSMANGTVGTQGVGFNAIGDRSSAGQSEAYADTVGLRLGRYQGGTVNASSVPTIANGGVNGVITLLGSNSVAWAMREVPTAIPLTGTVHYLPVFGTAPTDALGNVGTLNSAQLDADFSRQTVNPGVSATINGQTLIALGRDVPIGAANFGFDVTSSSSVNSTLSPAAPVSLAVNCMGTCPAAPAGVSGAGWGARISGGFAGEGTAASAFFRYTFNTRYGLGAAPSGQISNNYVDGLVGFGKGPQFAAPTGAAAGSNLVLTYFLNQTGIAPARLLTAQIPQFTSYESTSSFSGPGGNFDSVTEPNPPFAQTITVGGDTSAASTVTALANGVSYGRYAGVDVAGSGNALTATQQFTSAGSPYSYTYPVVGGFQWIQGPGIWPEGILGPMTGTATYPSASGSLPTDQNGATGALNSAALSVNFDTQSVSTSVNVTTPSSNNWIANANDIALQGDGHFYAATGSSAPHQTMSLTLNGSAVTAYQAGQISGNLTGPQLNGAILGYNFVSSGLAGPVSANGVVGFSNPTFSAGSPDVLAPYAFMLGSNLASPMGSGPDMNLIMQTQDPTRLKFDSKGGLVEFDTQLSAFGQGTGAARAGILAGGSPASGAIPAMPAISGTAATVAEFGFDAATGISWGRYSNGNLALVDRITAAAIGSVSGGPINHYLLSPVQSGPTTLPLSGTATYTFVGGTSPTDSTGAVGTLNSATLSANFTAKTVDAGLNLAAGGRNWTASATAVPIIGAAFSAAGYGGSGNLAIGCTGTGCGTPLSGAVVGRFTGPTGQGAGMAYTLNAGGSTGVTVGGVAAFRR